MNGDNVPTGLLLGALVVLLLLAAGLVLSLQVLDHVPAVRRASARAARRGDTRRARRTPHRPHRLHPDDQPYPSYAWEIAERAVLHDQTTPGGAAPLTEGRARG